MADKRPVHIITGFLGAGKTTLLNSVLTNVAFKNTAVIINEFGEVGLDHLLVTQSDDTVLELSNGCLCCTIRGELIDTILSLKDQSFDRLIIETTGLANPAPVAQAVIGHPEVSKLFELQTILTLVDAVSGAQTIANQIEAQQQIAMANKILITKSDLLDGDQQASTLSELSQRILTLNPLVEPEILSEQTDLKMVFNDRQMDVDNAAPGHADHHHRHHNHRIKTITLTNENPMPASAIERFMELITSAHGNSVLRIKGLVHLEEHPDEPLVVHGVQSVFHQPTRLNAWPDGVAKTSLVAIVQDFDPDFIRQLFDGFSNKVSVGTADRTALMENPLAVPGHEF